MGPPLICPQFGQSNPTYFLRTPSQRYVLRRAPSGPLLSPTAHRIDREYLILATLNTYNDSLSPAERREHAVPVPRVYCLCEDKALVGSAFYVMEFVEGRVITDVRMRSMPEGERRQWWVTRSGRV